MSMTGNDQDRREPVRDYEESLLVESARFEGGKGAVAWAVLEMFKRAGMESSALDHLQDQMMTYFAQPSDEDCGDILKVVERRLTENSWTQSS